MSDQNVQPDTCSATCPDNSTDKQDTAGEKLDAIRKAIDSVDCELLALLNFRTQLSKQVGEIKAGGDAPIYCPGRERELMDRLQEMNGGPLPNEHLLRIYTEILASSRAMQRPLQAACLGPAGTFSYLAAHDFLGKSTNLEPLPNLESVFSSVADAKTQLGVVPLENSLQGSVGQSLDLFLLYAVHISAEFFYRVQHSLLFTGQNVNEIKKIYSHPQPLAQCSGWLNSHLPNVPLFTAESTAQAAQLAANEAGAAAIGHNNLASLYNLNVVAENIEDQANNWTRFAVIAPGFVDLAKPSVADQADQKTTLLFTLNNTPGALAAVLNIITNARLNLSKLESRPALYGNGAENWSYTFFADVDANLLNKPEILAELKTCCHFLRVLGVYSLGRKL